MESEKKWELWTERKYESRIQWKEAKKETQPDGEGEQTRLSRLTTFFYTPHHGAGNPEMGVQSPWSGVQNDSNYPGE